MTELFKSIVYKQPKAITQYSPKFSTFVMLMLHKKKEMRPLITDCIDYLMETKVPAPVSLSELDKQNYLKFKD